MEDSSPPRPRRQLQDDAAAASEASPAAQPASADDEQEDMEEDGAEDEVDIPIAEEDQTDDSNVNSRASSRLRLRAHRRDRMLACSSALAATGGDPATASAGGADSPAALSVDGSVESGRRTRRGFYKLDSAEEAAASDAADDAEGAGAAAAAAARRAEEDIEEAEDEENDEAEAGAEAGESDDPDAAVTERDVESCLNLAGRLGHHAPLLGLLRGRLYTDRTEEWSRQVYTAPAVVSRLSLLHTYPAHTGCVNALSFCPFNPDLMASGSDDLNCCLSSVKRRRVLTTGVTGHHANVFQCKFISENHVVTAARDGQVRLCHFTSAGGCVTSRLAKHAASCHKLSAQPLHEPHEILSAGEDARVLLIDVRQSEGPRAAAVKLNVVRKAAHGEKVPLYSIHQHPARPQVYCVSGRDESVYLFDKRMAMSEPLATVSAPRLPPGTHVTAACFDHTGRTVLASYNDENIHLLDWAAGRLLRTFRGHRNNATVKGVNFFGPRSEYVVSGSDCGHVYLWDTLTSRLVHSFKADENGIVNVLEPHPHFPLLATSGLDNDFKLWCPGVSSEPDPAREAAVARTLRGRVRANLTERARDARVQPVEPNLLLMLMRQLSRRERRSRLQQRRRRAADGEEGGGDADEDEEASDSDASDDSESGSDSDSDEQGARCVQS